MISFLLLRKWLICEEKLLKKIAEHPMMIPSHALQPHPRCYFAHKIAHSAAVPLNTFRFWANFSKVSSKEIVLFHQKFLIEMVPGQWGTKVHSMFSWNRMHNTICAQVHFNTGSSESHHLTHWATRAHVDRVRGSLWDNLYSDSIKTYIV